MMFMNHGSDSIKDKNLISSDELDMGIAIGL